VLIGLTILPFFSGCIPVPISSEYPPGLVKPSTLDYMIGSDKAAVLLSLGQPDANFNSDTSSYFIYGAYGSEHQLLLMVWVPIGTQKDRIGKFFCVLLEFDEENIFRRYQIEHNSTVRSHRSNISDCALSFFTPEELKMFTIKDSEVELFKRKPLVEKAMQEDRDSQWKLYQELPTEENLIWLCRAADKGHKRARNELGELYFYGSDTYRKFVNIHIPANLSRSCMWFHLAGQAQIAERLITKDTVFKLGLYESVEVNRTANAMTAGELKEAEKLILAWQPGQCDRDFSLHLSPDYKKYSDLARLCKEADQGSFSARDKLGQTYFFGLKGVEPDLPHAYMWYYFAAMVYMPTGLTSGGMQSLCDAMTLEQRSIAVKLLDEWKPGKCEQDLLQ
jgi:hypothetical protein